MSSAARIAGSPAVHPHSSDTPRRIVVIGGGISGLAAAHRLRELAPTAKVTLLEASNRLGGVLGTDERSGYLVERSADMFTTREPWALDLCRRIGLEGELIGTDSRYRHAYVVRLGKLLPVPDGFTLLAPAKVWPIVTTRILSPLGKLRLACERFVPRRRSEGDESLRSFVVRRMGREVFDRIVQPLVGGIYTADPAKLSLQATMPQFIDMERRYGSVSVGMAAQAKAKAKSGAAATPSKPRESGARYGLFLAPRLGMQQLVDGIAARLPNDSIGLNTAVERIERVAERNVWRLSLRGEPAPLEVDDLVVAAPAHACSALLRGVDESLASLVGGISHAGCCVAVLGYPRESITRPLNFFGAVAPAIEKRKFIAASLASVKFAGRAPNGRVLLRVFVGGALQPELATLPDAELQAIVRSELAEVLGIRGEPDFCHLQRWLGTMPQYHVGHLDVVEQIEQRVASVPHFALAGNAYRGVGIPFCIRSGELAAERIVGQLAPSPPGSGPG